MIIRNVGDSRTYDIHRHPTTNDLCDGNNLHEVFSAHLGDDTRGNCSSKRPHGLHVTHLDSKSNEEEAHDKLRHGTMDARYTVVAAVQVNNRVKEPSVKKKEKNYHPDKYSRCGAVGCDLSKLTQCIITAIFMISQTSIHGGITVFRPQIEDDSITWITLAQHIVANIVMAILSADLHTQTHSKDIKIPRHVEVTRKKPHPDGGGLSINDGCISYVSRALDSDTCHDIGVAPHCSLTPWEVRGRLIVSVSIAFQWRGIKSRYSFVTDTLPNMDKKKKVMKPATPHPV